MRFCYCDDVGLASNVIKYYEMLLAKDEFKNWYDCIYEEPRTVGPIVDSESMLIYKEKLALKEGEYRMRY